MQLTVPDNVLSEIGRVTVYQSHIESELAYFIQQLLRIANDERGDIVTVKMSFNELVRVAGSLLRAEFGSENEYVIRFDAFSSGANVVFGRRNQFAHSVWGFGKDLQSETATRVKVTERKGSVKKDVELLSLVDLKSLSEKMNQLLWELSDIRVRVCHYEESARKF